MVHMQLEVAAASETALHTAISPQVLSDGMTKAATLL